ncbi:MAG: hypothetical protein ACE5EY_05435, partial [Anaerolineae bacterium]
MNDHSCPNCGQTILASDTICWHCGWQLPRKSSPATSTAPPMEESEAESYSLQTILAYVGMTVMVVVLAGWVMGSLGKRPLVVTDEQTTLPAGWTAVT